MSHAGPLLLALCVGVGTARGASLSLEKGPVVLGRTESVGVTLRVDAPPSGAQGPLRLAVNVGSFGPVTREGPGVYRTVYVPPPTRFPQVALVAVWHETGPEAPIEFLRIPLYGTTRLEVRARPGTEARVRVGLDEFGPVKAARNGRAVISANVPPDVHEAEVLAWQRNGASAAKALPIRVPPYNRLTAAVVPQVLLADGRAWARVDVLYDSGGKRLAASAVRLTPESGTVTPMEASDSRFSFRYQPPPGTLPREVRFRVSVDGDPASSATTSLKLGLPGPATLVLSPPAQTLSADGASHGEVTVRVFDTTGLALPGQQVEVSANGRRLEGLTEVGGGLYRVPFTAPAVYPEGGLVRFEATARGSEGPTARADVRYQLKPAPAPRDLRASLTPALLPADGATRARVLLDVRDAAGLPLSGARLVLLANHGAVSAATALEDGRYEATYLAPEGLPDGPVELQVTDASGQWSQRVPVSLRATPHALLVGVRAGFVHSLAAQAGPRLGLDMWTPFKLGGLQLGAGLTALAARVQQSVTDASGTLRSESEALYFPMSLRLGWELYAGRRTSVVLGAGATATWARFETSLTGTRASQLGAGGLGFLALGLALGPGQAFAEASFAFAPVRTEGFRLDAGGPGLEVGYRLGVL
ncbi:hypothetical protein JY651_26215 [Pyxidicoccus parkwayensis]|uniref:Invasin domain-containing protein n=1 Tax=Pyxidicoccus parkwayensis TaxID=2813578 RepID=A0ABX7NJ17_9BACT|nr:invasin domain 3-containing protein [Pyxidicoccus parkwaysis]QSQ18855.1 hypothetical protein JY651_26215 [Pyxidicoccus parkwaysis]